MQCNLIFFLVSSFLILLGVFGLLRNQDNKYQVTGYRVYIAGDSVYFGTYKEALKARQLYEKEVYQEGEDGWGELPEPVYVKI